MEKSQNKSSVWPLNIIVYTDGASRGNPGKASIGLDFLAQNQNESGIQVLLKVGEVLPSLQTNNFAEYTAVLRALQIAHQHGSRRVIIRSDSELMVRQMTGVYKVKSPVLIPLFQQCQEWIRQLESVRFEHVRREYNKEADRLANQALDLGRSFAE